MLKTLAILKTTPWTSLHIILVALICTLLAWIGQFHWRRRRLYSLASDVHGPIAWPFIGSAFKFMGNPGVILHNIQKMFEEYPDMCRIWFGNRLFFGVSKPEYLEIIMNSPMAYAKTDLYKYAEVVAGTGLFTAPVPKWKKHRKIILPTFNQRILDQFVDIFSEQSVILAENLEKLSDKEHFDAFDVIAKCTLDIICETAMGVKINAQTTNSSFGHQADRVMEIIFLRMFVIWYHFDFIFRLTPLYKDQLENVRKMHEFTGKIVREKRMAYEQGFYDESKRKAFLDLLIEMSSEAHFTDEELRNEVDTFMIAGSDTTASSSAFVCMMLGMHQDVQQKVYEEALDVLGPDRSVVHTDLPNLKYTERVIKETLRLFPVGAFVVRAIEQDIPLGKFTIPEGSSAVLGILTVHRNAVYWPDPLRFDPDRFLPENSAKRHPYTYMPFSAGPRNCIGPKYAMMAMKAMVATIVRKYRFSTPYRRVEDIKLKMNLVLRPQDGFLVSVQARV